MGSRFKSAEAYRDATGAPYKLLPFHFLKLTDGRYVLTNLSGEYVIVKRNDLFDLVNRCLDQGSSLYSDLLSKHFLSDTTTNLSRDLLALKVRTKYYQLSNFTSLHLFVVTLRCEHSCPYCQVSRRSTDRSVYDMSVETADRSLDLVFRSPSPAIKIEFQGGEPLLNFPLIQHVVQRAEKINGAIGRSLQIVVATNLALLTDEMLEFFREHDVMISTSLDGPLDLHNANRPRPGRDSYERAVDGIQRARAVLGRDRVSAVMTTTLRSLERVTEIVDEYLRLGFNGIFLRPLSPYGFAIKTKSYMKYDVQRWMDFYEKGLAYIIDINKNGVPFVEYYTSIILKKMLTPFEPGYTDLRSPAGIGTAALVYNYDGEVYASDEGRMLAETGDKTFRLGSVHNDSYQDILTSEALLEPLEQSFAGSVPMCVDCAFVPFCGSDPVFHHATQHDFVGVKPRSAFCQRSMGVITRLMHLLDTDSSARRVLLSWLN